MLGVSKRPKNNKAKKQKVFQLFERGLKPGDLTPYPGLKNKTVYTYYQLWKNKGYYGATGLAKDLIKSVEQMVTIATGENPLKRP